METNLLRALNNLSKNSSFKLKEIYSGENKINNMGDALEYFIKDIFCSSINIVGLHNKDKKHSAYLSYLGNQNHPPDFVIKNGDAVEVKKIKTIEGSLQLNSSYPKSKLHNDDSRIKKECKKCDGGNWAEKDIIYIIGSVPKDSIKVIWFLYGDCYAADREFYEATLNKVSPKVHEVEGIEFAKTKEIASVRRVDPLGITILRVRGMWTIHTPHKVFKHLIEFNDESDFSAFALILDIKYNSFPKQDRDSIESNPNIKIKSVEIKSPNNPANYLKAKLISFIS